MPLAYSWPDEKINVSPSEHNTVPESAMLQFIKLFLSSFVHLIFVYPSGSYL